MRGSSASDDDHPDPSPQDDLPFPLLQRDMVSLEHRFDDSIRLHSKGLKLLDLGLEDRGIHLTLRSVISTYDYSLANPGVLSNVFQLDQEKVP